jgi:hypothetical protein
VHSSLNSTSDLFSLITEIHNSHSPIYEKQDPGRSDPPLPPICPVLPLKAAVVIV